MVDNYHDHDNLLLYDQLEDHQKIPALEILLHLFLAIQR